MCSKYIFVNQSTELVFSVTSSFTKVNLVEVNAATSSWSACSWRGEEGGTAIGLYLMTDVWDSVCTNVSPSWGGCVWVYGATARSEEVGV